MRNKFIAMLTIAAVFGLAVAVYAYQQTSPTSLATASCCKDSCPMKSGSGHAKHEKSNKDCCGESCPMKNAAGKSHGADHAKGDCCGDNCPMKKEGVSATATASHYGDKKSCECECCSSEKNAETASL